MLCGTGRGSSEKPLVCAATYAYDITAALLLLKLAALSRLVLTPIELLMIMISL